MKFKNIKKNLQVGKKKVESPSNSRTIPASSGFSLPKIDPIKLLRLYGGALKVFVVFTFIAAVVIVGLDFKNNLRTKKEIDSQREALTHNLNFWEDFMSKHRNYPDAYFHASILEYKLGDISKAKINIEKGLSLDPNSENGKKLEKFLVNK